MISASNAFIDALRFGSNLTEARMTVYSNGQSTQIVVPISAASVTVDRNSNQRRSGSVTVELLPDVPPSPFMPTSPSSLLAPFGNEVFIEYGLIVAGGQTDYAPLGLFAIATTDVTDSGIDLVVTMDIYDRSWVISQRKFLEPYNFPATESGNFVAEIQALLNQVWGEATNAPPLAYNIAPTSATVPSASYNQGSDPWQAALDMANAVGYELFFDVHGVVTGYPVPNPSTQPVVWQFVENSLSVYGNANSNVVGSTPYVTPISIQSTFTRDRIYNDFIMVGSGSYVNAPVLGEAKDTNPNSPTYVNGPMGDIPDFVQSNFVSASEQAEQAAQTMLAQSLANAWQITVTAVPNPLFDIDDVVTVTDSRLGFDQQRMVIDTITHTVRYDDALSVTGRAVVA